MRKFSLALFIALFLGMSVSSAFAGLQIGSGGERGDSNIVLTNVFNNTTTAMVSGEVVIWDTTADDPTDAQLGNYVARTTTADSNLVAGIVYSASIPSGGEGLVITYGPTKAFIAKATDGATLTAGTALGTTTVSGQAGTGTGLGVMLRPISTTGPDREESWVLVNPSNGE